jgi:PPP family 3-phenylpropionic acid transporter
MAARPDFSTDHFVLRLGLFYAAYFFFGGVQLPFFPLWLESRGLDAKTIGMIVAVPTLLRIVVTPIVAHQADRRGAVKTTLCIGSVIGLCGMTAAGFANGPVAILIAFACAMAALSPMLSLSDAYALSGLGARGRSYGPVRLWGSVAFIGGNVGAGVLLGVLAPTHLIWLIVVSLILVVAAAVSLAPIDRVEASTPESPRPSPKALLSNPAFLAMVLASSMVQGSHALYYGFSTVQWRGEGFDGVLIGTLWGIGVAAEVALFAMSGRLPVRLRPTMLLAIGGLGAILRWTAMAFDPPVAALPALQLLHACSFGAAHLGMMGFLARAVPRGLAAIAQGIAATWSGLVNASATFASGFLYAATGSHAYLLMAGMALVGTISALVAGRVWKS